jgi:hypothetical protein
MPSDPIYDSLQAVEDEATFVRFVALLAEDRRCAERLPLSADGHQGKWANQTPGAFLEAANAWAIDSQFGLRPGPKSGNPWQLFASFLWAGRGYE